MTIALPRQKQHSDWLARLRTIMVLRPGQRVVNIPGDAVSVSRRAVSASATGDWWALAGKTCVAAYQPKGAADLAASYVNLVTPGTYNFTEGSAPTLSADGWVCDSNYLVTVANFSITGASARTLVGYMRLDETPAGFIGAGIPSLGDNNVAGNFSLLIGSSNELYGWVTGTDLDSGLTLSTGVFYPIAFQYDGTNMRIRRGSSTASNTPGSLNTSALPMRIARDANGRMGKVTISAAAAYSDALTDGEWATLSAAMAAL